MKKLILLASISLLFHTSLHAQQSTISYQGLIQGVNGSAVKDSTYPIAVSFWSDTAGGTQVWEDVFQTSVKNGIFKISLGSQVPLPTPSEMDQPLWLGVRVGGFSIVIPRSRLSATPMAINVADNAISTAKLEDSSVTTAKIADGAITWNKMGTEYVPYLRVNGAKVTTGHNSINFTGSDGMMVDYDSLSMSLIFHPDTSMVSENGKGGYSPLSVTPFSDITGAINTSQLLYVGTGSSMIPTGTGIIMANQFSGILPLANGGTNNIPQWSTLGGSGNSASDNSAAVGGGQSNIANNIAALVSGGFNNATYGDDGVVAGGEANTVGAHAVDPNTYHSAISGGADNTVLGINSSIAGGTSLILGPFSFGFNGDDSSETLVVRGNSVPFVAPTVNLSDTLGGGNYQSIAFFNNVNLMLGNVDDTARALQLYSPNTNRDFTKSTTYFSSFQAGGQTGNIKYTLPVSLPSTGQYLEASSIIGTAVGLSWVTPSGGGGGGGAYWSTTGNTSVPAPTYYLGTNDSEAFEIHVNNSGFTTGGNQRVMRYAPGRTSPNILGGSSANTIGTGLSGVAILSGGSTANPNRDSAVFSVVASGEGNRIDALSEYSSIGGGRFNIVTNSYESVIGGGYGNLMVSSNGVIGSGFNNTIENGISNGILGGDSNSIIGFSFSSDYSVVCGGYANRIMDANYGILGGGTGNFIQAIGTSDSGDICPHVPLGGSFSPGYDVLGGGMYDTIFATLGTLMGGDQNKIDTNAVASFLGGGQNNETRAALSTVGGGFDNVILPTAFGATIPGGVGLIAATAGQFVAGTFNIPDTTTNLDRSLAMFGAGLADNLQFNAFTISNNGHASAYQQISDTLGGGVLPTRMGTMYSDNTVEAWANVTTTTTSATIVADAGTLYILRVDTGAYLVHLNIVNQDGSPHTFSNGGAAITATLTPGPLSGNIPGMITVTQLSSGPSPTFTVKIYSWSTGRPVDNFGFQFHVVAR